MNGGDVDAVMIVAVATVRRKQNVCKPAKLVVAMGERLRDTNHWSFLQ
jgi:hypothetical protein